METLRDIGGDCTYQQADRAKLLEGASSYFSLDLSSATDRFPVELQELLLSKIIGSERAKA
jgi:hypothetical protein